MSNLIGIPYKLTSETPFWAPLLDIFPEFTNEERTLFEKDLRGLEELRHSCSLMFDGSTKTSLDSFTILTKYFSQISYLAKRLPKNQIVFNWNDIYQEKDIVSSTDLNFELSNILFNIGALLSQLGNEESRNTSDGIINSCKYFQEAAGVFQLLKENLYETCNYQLETICVDLEFNFLDFLCNLMLAQAQECCWQKAVINKMSAKAISQLAGHVSVLYSKAYEAASRLSLSGALHRQFLGVLKAKKAHFSAAALFRKAQEFSGVELLGTKIAYLLKAQKELGSFVETSDDNISLFVLNDAKGLSSAIQDQLKRANMINDWVYFHPIPKNIDNLATHSMVVAKLPATIVNIKSNIRDESLGFSYLIPYNLYLAPALYENRKNLFVESMFFRPLQKIVEEFNSVSRNPIINFSVTIDKMPEFPQNLSDKMTEIFEAGGASELTATLDVLEKTKEEAQRVLQENLEKASSILNSLGPQETISAEAQNLRPKIDLFRTRFSQASKTDETTVDGLRSRMNDFQLLFSSQGDYVAFVSSQLDESHSPPDLYQYSCSLKALTEDYQALSQDVSCKIELIKMMAFSDKLDIKLHQSSGMFPNLDDDSLEVIIETELKKYIQFQSYTEEKVKSHSVLDASFKALVVKIEKAIADAMFSEIFNVIAERCDQFKSFLSALKEGIQFYKTLTERAEVFYRNCVNLQ